jgi:hypothetical protein
LGISHFQAPLCRFWLFFNFQISLANLRALSRYGIFLLLNNLTRQSGANPERSRHGIPPFLLEGRESPTPFRLIGGLRQILREKVE